MKKEGAAAGAVNMSTFEDKLEPDTTVDLKHYVMEVRGLAPDLLVLDHLKVTRRPKLARTMSPQHKCLVGSKDLVDGTRFEIRAKRKKQKEMP